ncbi:MAG TPA: GNAT family N-acetyltransferase [Candidatus Paceibacterota bacterium]|nr:GNAT family N-acetyltransferase [Candidatus Paceibacterota bacterium]
MSVTFTPKRTVRCQPLLAADRPVAGPRMAAAFHDDPAIQYLLPNRMRRPAQLMWLMSTFVAYGARYGQVTVAGETPVGTAICLPSELATASLYRLLRCGWGRAPYKLGWAACCRLHTLTRTVQRQRLRLMSGRHLYLLHLSVSPACQGEGIGGALLDAVLEDAASQQLPCCLETFRVANLGFYMRHGFALLSEARLADVDLPFWILGRPGRHPGSSPEHKGVRTFAAPLGSHLHI